MYIQGDGQAFLDFLEAKFPQFRPARDPKHTFGPCTREVYHKAHSFTPQIVGRAELFKRQDWTCEASFHIYPLFEALMCYTIEKLLLEPNILRDSILVRMEMVTLFLNLNECPTHSLTYTLSLNIRCSLRLTCMSTPSYGGSYSGN